MKYDEPTDCVCGGMFNEWEVLDIWHPDKQENAEWNENDKF